MSLTTDPNDPSLNKPRADGQNEKYLVLSEEERKKGFVRPGEKMMSANGKLENKST